MGRRPSVKGKGVDIFFNQTAKQQNSLKEKQQAVSTVKATFYLTGKEVVLLEEIKLQRLKKGERTDKSALVREAICLFAKEAGILKE